MKILLFLILLSSAAFCQEEYSIQRTYSSGDSTTYVKIKTVPVYVYDGLQTKMAIPMSDTAHIFLSSDGQQYIGTLTWKKARVPEWTIKSIIENDNTTAIAYSAGWTNSTGQAKFFAGNFSWIPSPNGTQTAGTSFSYSVPIRVSFWSERATGHNPYVLEVKRNGTVVQTVTIDPRQGTIGSDKDRDQASFVSNTITPTAPGILTQYQLVIKPTGQMVVDRITIEVLE